MTILFYKKPTVQSRLAPTVCSLFEILTGCLFCTQRSKGSILVKASSYSRYLSVITSRLLSLYWLFWQDNYFLCLEAKRIAQNFYGEMKKRQSLRKLWQITCLESQTSISLVYKPTGKLGSLPNNSKYAKL